MADFDKRKAGRTAKRAAEVTTRTVRDIVALFFKIVGTILLIGLTTCVMFACLFAFYIKTSLEPQLDITLEDYALTETSYIMVRDPDSGEYVEWQEIIGKDGRRTWVDKEIPEYARLATVAIEDQRFYSHHGVDWYRTAGAIYTMFFGAGDDGFGASTITQQLIKNLTGEKDVTVKRKLLEIFRALELEDSYDKDEILTWYLNSVYFGEGAYGIQAAAETYFNKNAQDLTLAECASIVGITNMPTWYDPFLHPDNNKERQETILWKMYDQGFITHTDYTAAVAEELVFEGSTHEEQTSVIYTYYQEMVINEAFAALQETTGLSNDAVMRKLTNGGYRIYACIDLSIQAKVDAIYNDPEQIPKTWGSNQSLNSAMAIMNPYTGEVVAIAGGIEEKTTNFSWNYAVDTARPPGSSIKPLSVYGPALDTGKYTANSTETNSPITVDGSKFPRNDDGSYGNGNKVNLVYALQRSLNTIAVRIVENLGVDTSFAYLQNLGLSTLVISDNEGHTDLAYSPMALGQLTNGATVLDMTAAYCALANGGIYTESKTFSVIYDASGKIVLDNSNPVQREVFKKDTTTTLTAMLVNAVNNGTGTEAKLGSGQQVAGKTGTAGSSKDRWFCGYTPYYVAAVWTGYNTPETINVSGNPAAQLWKKVMTLVHEDLPVLEFDVPDVSAKTEEEKKVEICDVSGLLATDACRDDIDGSQISTVSEEDAPEEFCNLHESVSVCSETFCLPNATCTTVTVGALSSRLAQIPVCTDVHEAEQTSEPPAEQPSEPQAVTSPPVATAPPVVSEAPAVSTPPAVSEPPAASEPPMVSEAPAEVAATGVAYQAMLPAADAAASGRWRIGRREQNE